MRKGFTLSSILVLVAVFVLIPVGFLIFSGSKDVKGVMTSDSRENSQGILVTVKSVSGTWNLNQYLCKSEEQCLDTLDSGKEWTNISGGKTEGQQVFIQSEDSWSEYEYLKVYVRPGWGSTAGFFDLVGVESTKDIRVGEISSKGASHKVLLVPVSDMQSGYSGSFTFSD